MIRNTLISFGRASISIGHIPDGCLCNSLKICGLAQLAIQRAGQEGSIVHDNGQYRLPPHQVRRRSRRGETCLPVEAGPRAEAKIRIRLMVQSNPAGISNSGGVFSLFLNTQPDRFPSRSSSEINATLVRRSLPGAPLGTSPRGIPLLPTQSGIPIPHTPFPSIVSPRLS